jgi:hypothetical protein
MLCCRLPAGKNAETYVDDANGSHADSSSSVQVQTLPRVLAPSHETSSLSSILSRYLSAEADKRLCHSSAYLTSYPLQISIIVTLTGMFPTFEVKGRNHHARPLPQRVRSIRHRADPSTETWSKHHSIVVSLHRLRFIPEIWRDKGVRRDRPNVSTEYDTATWVNTHVNRDKARRLTTSRPIQSIADDARSHKLGQIYQELGALALRSLLRCVPQP